MRSKIGRGRPGYELPVLVQFDATRDVRATFYVLYDWRAKHKELGKQLAERFGTAFRNNSNSFASCFQFVQVKPLFREQGGPFDVERRIKVYDKHLSLFQSEGVMKSIGMNTKAIFYSPAKMYQELREACHDGLARIEISYGVESLEQEKVLLHPTFHKMAAIDLDLV